jgi:double-stranded RNA-binding protein Staufen
LKRESSSLSVSHSATATLPANNSSIITGPPPVSSVVVPSSSLSHHPHHHQQQYSHHHQQHPNTIIQKPYLSQPPHHQHHSMQNEVITPVMDNAKIPVVSANKENIPLTNILSNNDISSDAENTEQGVQSLENAKEKTPMCLVNELARFNKILHQYRLVKENGPAHKKRFTVVLKLGDEEYAAEDLSIKKAQHAAARDAIMKTGYKHPPLKKNRIIKGVQVVGKGNSGNITPTVELNALAMKRGEPTTYSVVVCNQIASTASPYGQPPPQPFGIRNAPFQRKFGNQRGGAAMTSSGRFNSQFSGTETFQATLVVGTRTFLGMGPTQQAARHDAAAR